MGVNEKATGDIWTAGKGWKFRQTIAAPPTGVLFISRRSEAKPR